MLSDKDYELLDEVFQKLKQADWYYVKKKDS